MGPGSAPLGKGLERMAPRTGALRTQIHGRQGEVPRPYGGRPAGKLSHFLFTLRCGKIEKRRAEQNG